MSKSILTDLQQMLIMLSKSEESFSKDIGASTTTIHLSGRGISIYFKEDDSFDFISRDIIK